MPNIFEIGSKSTLSKDDIINFKKLISRSRIKTYTNGYESHWIDEHPHGSMYRNPNNSLGLVAVPDESIMVVKASTQTVVVFLKGLSDLEEFENSMNLIED